ncbi:MAG: dienelactone hydrolase family protein, partial [Gammaproteobacteria bacterium]
MNTTRIKYNAGSMTAEAFVAYKDSLENKPVVIVSHDWTGRNEFACEKAKKLAELGYVGFALDMFGNAQLGETKEEKSAMIQPLVDDRGELLKRMTAAVETAQKMTKANLNQLAAIGFC